MKGIAIRHKMLWKRCSVLMMLILLLLPDIVSASDKNPTAHQGVMDLTDWHFSDGGLVPLSGQWEFYWNRLLEPSVLTAQAGSAPPVSVVPHVWGKNVDTPREGYATYRLKIVLGHEQAKELKAVYIKGIASAYRLYVNGELLAETGTVGRSRAEMSAQNYSKVISFPVREGVNELVIQASNFVQRKGGIWTPIQFGNSQDVARVREIKASGQIFIASCLATMGMYHLALFFLRKKDKLSLMTSIFCSLMALRVMVLGDTLLVRFYPWMEWEWAVKAEYLSVYLGLSFFAWFTQMVYPKELKWKVTLSVCGISGIFASIVLLFPARIFTLTMVPFEIFLLVVLCYWLYILAVATVRKRIGALLSLVAAIVLVATVINDVLYYSHVIITVDMSPYGVLLFFFVQTLVIAQKYSKAYVDVEHYSAQMSSMNQKLEESIKERTEALEVTNAYLVYANEHLNQLENSRRELIANVTHELGTPMTSIQGYMKALLDGVIQPEKQYIQIIYDKIQMAERLVQDLFDLTKLEEGQTTFHMVDVIVDDLFTEHFSNYQWDVESQNIRFRLVKPECRESHLPIVHIDPIRIRQVITNLIHNALNYTDEGGMISIRGAYGRDRLIIQVTDTGKGIEPNVLPNIFDRFVKGSGPRRHTRDGSGLGLAIAKEIVMHHGGILTVQSELGKGSTFQFDIPVEFIPMVVD
jgi:signal transduction histidine kinase